MAISREPRQRLVRSSLYGLALALLAIGLWRSATYVPRHGPPHRRIPAGPHRSAAPTRPSYDLVDGQVLRFIPSPDPDARRAACRRAGLADSLPRMPIVSMTFVYDDELRFRNMEVGYEYTPRRLTTILQASLGIPTWRIRGWDVAQQIGLSGDWIVRADATPEALMAALQDIVRQAGYPGFRIRSLRRRIDGYVLRSQARPNQEPIELLPPVDLSKRGPIRQTSVEGFVEALSNAIEHPVRWAAQPKNLTIRWRDHSPARRALGMPLTPQLVRRTLDGVAQRLGLRVGRESVEALIWELALEPQASP